MPETPTADEDVADEDCHTFRNRLVRFAAVGAFQTGLGAVHALNFMLALTRRGRR